MRSKRELASIILLSFILIINCANQPEHDIDFLPVGAPVIVMDKAKITLDDGDTFTYDGTTFRFLGIDTPEISHPEHGFYEDQPFGREAAAFTAEAIEKAKTVVYVPYQVDRYGRTLAHIFVDGDLLGIKLIKAGLADETVSHYGDNGFPKLAERILEAAKDAPRKDFIPPYKWRQEHRKEPADTKAE